MRLPKRDYWWPLLIVAALQAASSQPRLAAPGTSLSLDKLAHFLVFGLLATAIFRIPAVRSLGAWRGGAAAVGAAALYGCLDEFRQTFTPGRSVEFADWLADVCGATMAVALYNWIGSYRRALEWTPWRRRGRARVDRGPATSQQ